VLFHRCHERLSATLDRHGFGDQVIGTARQQALEPGLALNERQGAQIFAVEPQQVESDETRLFAA
jgi:hypothetical protein